MDLEYYQLEYTNNINKQSSIMRLLNTPDYYNTQLILKKISTLNWIKTNYKGNIYDINTGETKIEDIYQSSIFSNININIVDVFKISSTKQQFEIIVDKGSNTPLYYGDELYITDEDNTIIKLGDFIKMEDNKITIHSNNKLSFLIQFRNYHIHLKIKLHAIQQTKNYVNIYVPIFKLKTNNISNNQNKNNDNKNKNIHIDKWCIDNLLDKRKLENENGLIFNLLDDLNLTNKCGLFSIGLIGLILGIIITNNIKIKLQDNKLTKKLSKIYSSIKKDNTIINKDDQINNNLSSKIPIKSSDIRKETVYDKIKKEMINDDISNLFNKEINNLDTLENEIEKEINQISNKQEYKNYLLNL